MGLNLRIVLRRMAPLVDRRGPGTRFAVARRLERLKLLPGSLFRLANQFQQEGNDPWALRCWSELHLAAPSDPAVLVEYLACAFRAEGAEATRALYRRLGGSVPVAPSRMVWLAGQMAVRGAWSVAAGLLDDWQRGQRDVVAACRRAPSLVSPLIGPDVATLAQRMAESGETSALAIELARLCFTHGHPETAARLYRRAGDVPMDWLDRVALRVGEPSACTVDSTLPALAERATQDPDVLFSLARVALLEGEESFALAWSSQAFARKYPGVDEGVNQDVRAMLVQLAALKQRSFDLPANVLDRVATVPDPAPKRFVCGFGWTGSGAVYDAIRGHADFVEFEGAGMDAVLNVDSDTEATFIQSTAGLGRLWLKARNGKPIVWEDLWNLFRCHVVGLAPVGYSEYKSTSAAASHIRKYGAYYTQAFRDFFDGFAALLDTPHRGGLHALLLQTTESLCRMLLQQTGGKVVLLNNAVFGRDAVMLEIFAGHYAAIVYRDPRDVYVDRMRNDKNHWRSARAMADFYDQGLQRYMAQKISLTGAEKAALREVPFEQFVADAAFREQVTAWLLEGVASTTPDNHFDPSVSRRNIGIHHEALAAEDRRWMNAMVKTREKMDGLAAASWNSH